MLAGFGVAALYQLKIGQGQPGLNLLLTLFGGLQYLLEILPGGIETVQALGQGGAQNSQPIGKVGLRPLLQQAPA